MQQTLYSKPFDGFPPPPNIPVQSTVYTHPTENPNFKFLSYRNFLSEFKTEVDKAKVRENLGIPDEYSYNWGHIGGAISNQADLKAILDRITNRQQGLETQINGLSGQINTILGNFDDNLTAKSLYSEILQLKIDVAQNSRDIAGITSGGDTTLSNRVSANTSSIQTIQSRLEAIDSIISGGITYNDTEIRQQLASLQQQVASIQSQISSNELTGITVSQNSINVELGTADQTVVVTAHYTKTADIDITDRVICNSSNSNVAYWNNKVIIVGAGSATLTFTFEGKTAEISVEVTQSQVQTNDIFYIGYTTSVQELLTGTTYQKTQLNGVWNDTNIPKQFVTISGSVNFYVAVPTKYNSVTITQAGLPVGSRMSTIYSSLGVNYYVYKISGITQYGNEFTISII